ncbi:unnamed protein product, partial [Ectocarpus sp. 4 AP-2014]
CDKIVHKQVGFEPGPSGFERKHAIHRCKFHHRPPPAVPRAIYWNCRGCIQVPHEDFRQPLRSTKSCGPLTRDPPVVVGVKKVGQCNSSRPWCCVDTYIFGGKTLRPASKSRLDRDIGGFVTHCTCCGPIAKLRNL